jgi:hypothetical protein
MNKKGLPTLKICEQKLKYLNYSQNTINIYIHYINEFLQSQSKSALHLNSDDFQSYLDNYNFSSISKQNQIINAIRFLYMLRMLYIFHIFATKMKEIKIQNSNKVSLVDDDDFEFYDKFKWYLCSHGYVIYGRKDNNFKSYQKLHRLIIGAKDGEIVDHIDRNPLNNIKSNLRIVTCAQNTHNRKKAKNTKNNYKGVTYIDHLNLWQSRCRIYGNDYYLGVFKSEIAAAHAYNVKAKSLSEYCVINNLSNYTNEYLNHILISHRKKIKKHEGSKYKYIGFKKKRGRMKNDKFNIQFTINKKRYYKGYFNTENEALQYLQNNYSHMLNDIGSLK